MKTLLKEGQKLFGITAHFVILEMFVSEVILNKQLSGKELSGEEYKAYEAQTKLVEETSYNLCHHKAHFKSLIFYSDTDNVNSLKNTLFDNYEDAKKYAIQKVKEEIQRYQQKVNERTRQLIKLESETKL